MKKIIYLLILVICLCSCSDDNYDAPSETFSGTLIDQVTGSGFQTEVGDNGVRFKMSEISYDDNPTPWYFTCRQNGEFQDTKVFAGTYNIIPLGAFVPFVQTNDDGDTTKNESVTIAVNGAVTHDFTVDPFLVVSWVGDPVVSNGKITVQAKIERGTSDPGFQQDCADIKLFVNSSSYYVGDNNYDSRYTVSVDNPNDVLGQTITITTPELPYSNATYYIRVGARINYTVDGTKRYNYNEPLAVTVP